MPGFFSGFFYGVIADQTNVALRSVLCKKIDVKTTSPEVKAANYIFVSTMPWVTSAGIMHMAYKTTGNALFKMHPVVALGTALITELYIKEGIEAAEAAKTTKTTKDDSIIEDPVVLAFRPLKSGIIAGFGCSLIEKGTFMPGLFYGAIAGQTNVALRSLLCKKIDAKTTSPEAKAANYLFASTMPWVTSAGIMHVAYKTTGNALFRLHPGVALGAAVVTELLTTTNSDLLPNSTPSKPSSLDLS